MTQKEFDIDLTIPFESEPDNGESIMKNLFDSGGTGETESAHTPSDAQLELWPNYDWRK